jgi:integrase
VQAILGHASSRMTQEVYTHLVPAHQAEALPILAELLPPLASA